MVRLKDGDRDNQDEGKRAGEQDVVDAINILPSLKGMAVTLMKKRNDWAKRVSKVAYAVIVVRLVLSEQMLIHL